jgi:hypothetical protein
MSANRTIISLLLCIQVISTLFLWTLDATDIVSEAKFAIFLAIDLLCFALVAYIYRKSKWEQVISRVWILVGSFGLVVLLFAGLLLP